MYIFNEPNYELYDEPFFGIAKGAYCEETKAELFIPETFVENGFADFIDSQIKEFHYYGPTEISKRQWKKIKKASTNSNETTRNILKELEPWVNDNYKSNKKFTILGI